MWYVLFTVAALHAFGAVTGWAGLARHPEPGRTANASSETDYARYRGTGESAGDLQPLTREELEREYRVEECDGLLWVYDRQTGELVFLVEKGTVPGQGETGRSTSRSQDRPRPVSTLLMGVLCQ